MSDTARKLFTGPKTYQVWHDRGWPQSRINQILGGYPPSEFPQDYFHAADVMVNSLQEAVERTTHDADLLGDDVPLRPWDRNEGVQSFTPRPYAPRDTSVGDVIVDPQGQAFRVEDGYFKPIEPARTEIEDEIHKLQGVYEALGLNGLKDHGDAEVRLLFSSKQLELDGISTRLDDRAGSALDVLLKGQLEAEVRDLSGELAERGRFSRMLNDPPAPTPAELRERENVLER